MPSLLCRSSFFILAWPFIQSTIVLLSSLISSVDFSPGTGAPKSRERGRREGEGGRSLGIFVGRVALDSFFLPTGCFIDSIQIPNDIFLARLCLLHECFPVLPLTSPSRHWCVPLNPSVVEPNFVLPSLDMSHAIPHEDRPKRERRAQHNGDITIIHGPRHSCPKFVSIFLRQQWQAHLPPTDPHEPRCSDFEGHPGFRHSARSKGAQNLSLPRTHLVDRGSTPQPIDTTVQYCAVHMTVHPFAFGRHGDSLER